MNNTDDLNFWEYPLYFKIFIIYILVCTAMTDLSEFLILIVIYQLIGNVAFFNGTILFIILLAILLIGVVLTTILNVVFNRFFFDQR